MDGDEKLFFVVESKGTLGLEFLRPSEQGKIECGKRHFEELSAVSGSEIKLMHVVNNDDFLTNAMANS
jgi:type III restriction enzyme